MIGEIRIGMANMARRKFAALGSISFSRTATPTPIPRQSASDSAVEQDGVEERAQRGRVGEEAQIIVQEDKRHVAFLAEAVVEEARIERKPQRNDHDHEDRRRRRQEQKYRQLLIASEVGALGPLTPL